jgi:hypothetical protein
LKVIFSLGFSDFREMLVGFVSVVKTLGLADGMKAFIFATGKHMAAVKRGEGLYPEKGKQRIWFKLHFLKYIYQYIRKLDEAKAIELFDSIIKGPTIKFISHLMPPALCFTKDFTLHHAWQELIKGDYNIVAEVSPPRGNSVSLHVRRCFINEVVRDIGLLPVADRICFGDFIFWESYHPNVKFSRTKTLLAGDDFCNHTLTWIK